MPSPASTLLVAFLAAATAAAAWSSACAPPRELESIDLFYLRRVRKAGSTTFFRTLQRFLTSNNMTHQIFLQADEQNPMNARCILDRPLLVTSRVLFVTRKNNISLCPTMSL